LLDVYRGLSGKDTSPDTKNSGLDAGMAERLAEIKKKKAEQRESDTSH
jgi:hypothetical protein